MKKLVCLFIIMVLVSNSLVTGVAGVSNVSRDYIGEFEEYLISIGCGPQFEGEDWYVYEGTLYEYFSDDNLTETPDWALCKGRMNLLEPRPCYGVFGDYYIEEYNIAYPFDLGYCIYVPEENKFYTLEYAYNKGFAGIESIFTEYFIPQGLAKIIGDADGDYKLSILDASFIQLAIAEFCEFSKDDYIGGWTTYGEELDYISDIDRDGERTVLDATAIQYKLAGLEFIPDTNE